MNFILKHLHIWEKDKDIFKTDFLRNNANASKPFSTIVIGQNGTGKSYLLKLIVQLFRELDSQLKQEKSNFANCENFKIVFLLNSKIFDISRLGRNSDYKVFINEMKSSIYEIELPQKVLSVSFMVNDKFHFQINYS